MSDRPAPSPAWDDSLLRDPHAVADKRQRVQKMFAAIAPSYDLNNRLHSLWMDQRWRRKTVKLAQLKPTDRVVDVACGTGDLSYFFMVELVRANDRRYRNPRPAQIVGIDFALPMLELARKKIGRPYFDASDLDQGPPGELPPDPCAMFVNGDALVLPLPDAC
jgi:ubiquinone/menaquinone biosynthesis C-methylase UbiE